MVVEASLAGSGAEVHEARKGAPDGWALVRGSGPRLALAPMEGISDAVVRALLSELGGMDLCVTEFIRVTDRPLKARVLREACPELDEGGRTPAGTPVLVQLLGSNRAALAETAAVADHLGALGIDLNFGCPARRVNGHDGGAALLRDPRRVEQIVRAVRDAVPAVRPVSAKIRLGWENPDDVVDVARAAEAGGASFITIHGRTKLQMYRPSADWRRIGLARAALSVPVVANGDVFTPADFSACVERTGCSSVMLGRGAFRTPNLFRWIRGRDPAPFTSAACAALLRRFVSRMLSAGRHGSERGALSRLKQWSRAIGEVDEAVARCFRMLKRSGTLAEALAVLEQHFPSVPAEPSGHPKQAAFPGPNGESPSSLEERGTGACCDIGRSVRLEEAQ